MGAPRLLLAVGAFFRRTGKDHHQEKSEAASREGVRRGGPGPGLGSRAQPGGATSGQSGQQRCCPVSSRAQVPGSPPRGCDTHLPGSWSGQVLTYKGCGAKGAPQDGLAADHQAPPSVWPKHPRGRRKTHREGQTCTQQRGRGRGQRGGAARQPHKRPQKGSREPKERSKGSEGQEPPEEQAG